MFLNPFHFICLQANDAVWNLLLAMGFPISKELHGRLSQRPMGMGEFNAMMDG